MITLRYAVLAPLLCAGVLAAGQVPAAPTSNGQQPSANAPSKHIHAPVPTHMVDADFPDEARRKKIEGICLVSMIVDKYGAPVNPKIVRCTDPVFGQNSLEAAKKYRFEPARDDDGNPVPVMVTVEVNFRLSGSASGPNFPVSYSWHTPPGVTSIAPDARGVFPLTKAVEVPKLTAFPEDEFGEAVFVRTKTGSGGCDVLLTIDAKGKPSDPVATQCDQEALKAVAVDSLMKSHFKAGRVGGKTVPVRALIHIAVADLVPAS
jgi:TonB family protein